MALALALAGPALMAAREVPVNTAMAAVERASTLRAEMGRDPGQATGGITNTAGTGAAWAIMAASAVAVAADIMAGAAAAAIPAAVAVMATPISTA